MRQVGATLHHGARASHYRGLLLQSTGSRCAGSVIVAHGPSCFTACGIFPDQGSNPCPLHWQADSQPLRHPGSPFRNTFISLTLPHRIFWTLSFTNLLPKPSLLSLIPIEFCHLFSAHKSQIRDGHIFIGITPGHFWLSFTCVRSPYFRIELKICVVGNCLRHAVI